LNSWKLRRVVLRNRWSLYNTLRNFTKSYLGRRKEVLLNWLEVCGRRKEDLIQNRKRDSLEIFHSGGCSVCHKENGNRNNTCTF
jgi:hypothetical protein